MKGKSRERVPLGTAVINYFFPLRLMLPRSRPAPRRPGRFWVELHRVFDAFSVRAAKVLEKLGLEAP